MAPKNTQHNMPTVVLIGRANVGKSTLFNTFIDQRKALTSDIAGTTRDINEGYAFWQGFNFRVLDTGGIDTIVSSRKLKKLSPKENEQFAVDILKRSQAALDEADIILFVVDAKTGVLPADETLARHLRKRDVPVLLVANKIDTPLKDSTSSEFVKLGMGIPHPASALTGNGIGDLLDEISTILQTKYKSVKEEYYEPQSDLRIAIVGQPNVGKSSMFNSIVGREEVIVSEVAHTTREPKDTIIEHEGTRMTFIDTAGIRRKAKVEKGLEKGSVSKSIFTIKRADIALFVIDVSRPISVQDKHLAEILKNSDVSIIIVANKFDLIEDKHTNIQKELTHEIHKDFPFLTWAPIVFISAKTGKHVQKLFDVVKQIDEQRKRVIEQSDLDAFITRATKKHKPVAEKGIRRPVIRDFTQVSTNPPKFELRIRRQDNIATTYLRYLENLLREEFKLYGTKLWITVKK